MQNLFTLENFEGPLDFLLHLIQKNEIDIYEISLQEITDQYLLKHKEEPELESGAEFIGTTASLMLLKSRMLLPKHEQEEQPVINEKLDPRFDIIHQLIDYCRFKDAAKVLSEREEQQQAFFGKGTCDLIEPEKGLGIEHLTLQDLAQLFQQVLTKAASNTRVIQEEVWRVADKITLIRDLLKDLQKIDFSLLFSGERSREELIVTFLAVLEMMKLGELAVLKEVSTNSVIIVAKHG